MALKDKLLGKGLKLVANPRVAKLAQDERVMRFMMQAMAVPGRVSSFTDEQKESFAKIMGLATSEEVRDLRRMVASLEDAVRRLESREPRDR